jgi:hypothetical protein
MQFRVGQLLLEATHDRRGEHDVANGTEPYEEDFFQNRLQIFQQR